MKIQMKEATTITILKKGKEIVDQQTNPTMSPSYINEITDKINNAKTIYMVLKN